MAELAPLCGRLTRPFQGGAQTNLKKRASAVELMVDATATNSNRIRVRAGAFGAGKKQAAEEVARIGFDAMLRGDDQLVAGLKNKLQAASAHVTPGVS